MEDLSFVAYDWTVEPTLTAKERRAIDGTITTQGQAYQREHSTGPAFIRESKRCYRYWSDGRTRLQQLAFYKWKLARLEGAA